MSRRAARPLPRPFPVGPVLSSRRADRHLEDTSGITMLDVAILLKCTNGQKYPQLRQGLTVEQADTVAVRLLGKHPCEVWPVEWWSACEADMIVDDILAREAKRTLRFVTQYLTTRGATRAR